MLTMVKATRGPNVLELPLDESTESFYVTDISGLGSKQNILMEDSLYIPGGTFIGTTSPMRNITLKIVHKNRNVSLSERRRELAKYFAPGGNVVLEFHSDDSPTMQTVGGVETLEMELFVKEPAIVISILCQPVTLYGMAETTFPSTITTPSQRTINYEGTAPTGFKLSFTPFSSLLTITNVNNPAQYFKQTNVSDNTPASSYPRGSLSTVYGNRYFKSHNAAGTNSWDAFECLDQNSTWLQLYPGPNVFSFASAGAAITITEFKWTPLYEGV